MNKLLAALLMILTSSFALAQGPYFCTGKGRTLYYERYEAGNSSKLVRTTTFEIGDSKRAADGTTRVDYSLTVRKAGGKPMYGGKAAMYVTVDKDNNVLMDTGASLCSIVNNMVPGVKTVSDGGITVLPADMKAGDRLPDAHSVVNAAGVKYTVDITSRKVLRSEEVTVPAGTFRAVVLREHKIEKGPLHYRNVWGDSWYVPSLGYVRHDTYDSGLKLETVELLVRM